LHREVLSGHHRADRSHRPPLARPSRRPSASRWPQNLARHPAVFDLGVDRLELVRRPLVAAPGRLRRESDAAERDRLSRMTDIPMVQRFRRAGLLVSVPAGTLTYYVAGVCAPLRAARPWTKDFIEHMSRAFHRLFADRLRITSLTRTRVVQRMLLLTNSGAAPAAGPVQSTHLTGASLDISKRTLSPLQVAWLRTVLDHLNRQGLIHVVEEFQEPHFHVMVKKRYLQHESALDTKPRRRLRLSKKPKQARSHPRKSARKAPRAPSP